MQNMPVVPAVSQSSLPHAQADGLAAEPSVVAHAAGREQVLDAAVQTRPVPCPSPLLVQSNKLPHAHADGLAAEPSVVAQVGNWLHLFWDRSQCMPVVPAVSQSTLPHAQSDGLAAEPSVVAQVGPARHLFWDR